MVNRSGYIAASIAHGSFGGIGVAIFFGFSILISTTLFALFLSLVLAMITYNQTHRSDTLIGVIWAVGMSIGLLLVDLTPGYHGELMGYLFGDILMIPKSDIWFMAGVDLLLLVLTIFLYHRFLILFYDREFAYLLGLNIKAVHIVLYLLIGLSVVMSIRMVGLILVIALFSIPPFIAERHTTKLYQTMLLAGVLSFIFCVAGIVVSYYFDIQATAVIILIAAAVFFLEIFVVGKYK